MEKLKKQRETFTNKKDSNGNMVRNKDLIWSHTYTYTYMKRERERKGREIIPKKLMCTVHLERTRGVH